MDKSSAKYYICKAEQIKEEEWHQMQRILNSVKTEVAFFSKKFVKWLLISVYTGALCGIVGSLFHMAVNQATGFRQNNPFLIYFLPVCGLIIAFIYSKTGMEGHGTNDVIDSIHEGNGVSVKLVPVIFVSTALTHLCGGSAGREGAALQIGGGIGSRLGRLMKLDEKDMRLITLCGMSAVFSALFGTPLTASVFSLEVISVGIVYYSGLLPCIMASLVAYQISLLFGLSPTRYAVVCEVLSPSMIIKVAVLAVITAVVSIIFCEGMHKTEAFAKKIGNPYIRSAVGGAIILALTFIVGSNTYNGAGGDTIVSAIEKGSCPSFGFLWKIVFTAISLGFGFKGGEIVPTFFTGACLGCVLGPVLGIPAGFAAALALTGLFCGNVNCPIASIILSIELFGSEGLIYFAVMCCISYMLSGYFSLYKSQKIMYSKTKPEYINRFAE